VFELEHYGNVKKQGNWEGRPGSSVAKFGQGKSGPDYFRGALVLLHASYIGYHGDAHAWLADNPELTKELLNRCGYWLFPKSIEIPEQVLAGNTLPLTLTMENRGVAPPYAPYELRAKLSGAGTNVVCVMAKGCKTWLPGKPAVSSYELSLPSGFPSGPCTVALGLFDVSSGKDRPVEFGLKSSARDSEGYYRVVAVSVSAAPTSTR
jgi:hypothetical protein